MRDEAAPTAKLLLAEDHALVREGLRNMLESEPDLEVLIVPVGGGSGAAGACIVAGAINPAIRVIGVQAAGRRPSTAPGRRAGGSRRRRRRPSRRGWRRAGRSTCRSPSCRGWSTS